MCLFTCNWNRASCIFFFFNWKSRELPSFFPKLLKIKTWTLSFLWVIIIHLLTVEWIKKFGIYPFFWSSSRRQMRMEICHVRNELCHVRSVLKKYYKQPQKNEFFKLYGMKKSILPWFEALSMIFSGALFKFRVSDSKSRILTNFRNSEID